MASEAEPQEAPSTTLQPSEPADLASKIAVATQLYSVKNYEAAADVYSEAVALQAEQNGEMALENANLLYAYGRCLYHLAVSKSDVLGGKVAGDGKASGAGKRKRKANGETSGPSTSAAIEQEAKPETASEAVLEAVVEQKDGAKPAKEPTVEDKPYFTFTGDENWDDSDDEEGEDAEADEAADEEEDDFATAYEILEVARVLFERTLEEPDTTDDAGKGKGKATGESPERRELKERLADAHDLQAEICLENERFVDAISDSKASLALKQELYPVESSIVAEAHYKLSLALEFASVTTTVDANGEPDAKESKVDESMREDAAKQMELAISSTKLRVEKEVAALPSLSEDEASEKKKSIADVKEIISDMEQRLIDLRSPAVNLNTITGTAGAPNGADPLRGILGAVLGESPAAQKARIEDAVKGANDLTASIRHKKKPKADPEAGAAATNGLGKRKVEAEAVDAGGKKTKVEDA